MVEIFKYLEKCCLHKSQQKQGRSLRGTGRGSYHPEFSTFLKIPRENLVYSTNFLPPPPRQNPQATALKSETSQKRYCIEHWRVASGIALSIKTEAIHHRFMVTNHGLETADNVF